MKFEITFTTRVEANSFTVSAVYDFSAAGLGTFTFDPVPRFQVVGLDDTIKADIAHSVSITVTGDVSRRELNLEKRVIVQCDDDQKRGVMFGNYAFVQWLARVAISYIDEHGPGSSAYRRYFGTNTVTVQRVIDNFNAIATGQSVSLTCSSASDCGSREPVFIVDKTMGFCDEFFGPSFSPIGAFCSNPADIQSNRAGLPFLKIARRLPSIRSVGRNCDDSAMRTNNDEKISIAHSYAVSTQTPLGALGAHVLIWGYDLCSVSLVRPTKPQSVDDHYNYLHLYVPASVYFRAVSTTINFTLQKLCVGYTGCIVSGRHASATCPIVRGNARISVSLQHR